MSNTISAIRAFEQNFLVDGKLSKSEVESLAKFAKVGAEEKAAVTKIFSQDEFASDITAKEAAKLAGIDAKDIKRNEKLLGSKVGKGVDVASGKTVDAKVARILGDGAGYQNKFQAIAAARLSIAPNAAVIEKGGKWYAVETTPELKAGEKGKIAAVDLKKYEDVQTDKTLSAPEKYKKLASMAYGVPEDQINVYDSTGKVTKGVANGPDANKINVDLGLEANKMGTEGHGPGQCSCHGARIDGKPAAVSVSTHLLDRGPMRAATTLYHEGVHAADRARANDLYNKLDMGSGKINLDTSSGMTKVTTAIEKGKYNASERAALYQHFGIAQGARTSDKYNIEARAYAKSIAMAADKDPVGLKDQIVGLGAEVDIAGKFDPNALSFKVLIKELRAVYDTLPEDKQTLIRNLITSELSKGHPAVAKALLAELPQ